VSAVADPHGSPIVNPRARRRRLLRKRFLRRPVAVGGLFVVLGFVVLAVFAPWIAPQTSGFTDFNNVLAKPGGR